MGTPEQLPQSRCYRPSLYRLRIKGGLGTHTGQRTVIPLHLQNKFQTPQCGTYVNLLPIQPCHSLQLCSINFSQLYMSERPQIMWSLCFCPSFSPSTYPTNSIFQAKFGDLLTPPQKFGTYSYGPLCFHITLCFTLCHKCNFTYSHPLQAI